MNRRNRNRLILVFLAILCWAVLLLRDHFLDTTEPNVQIDGRSLAELREILAIADPESKVQACRALARNGEGYLIQELITILRQEKTDDVRAAALSTLLVYRLHGKTTVEQSNDIVNVLSGITSNIPDDRRDFFLFGIFDFASSAQRMRFLRESLLSTDEHRAWLAVDLWVNTPPGSFVSLMPELSELARRPEPACRQQWAIVAGHSRRPEDLPELQRLLLDPNPTVRYQSALAVGSFGAIAAPVAVELTQRLDDDNSHVRFAAARSLGEIGTATPTILTKLDQLMTYDEREAVRHAARNAIDRLTGQPRVEPMEKKRKILPDGLTGFKDALGLGRNEMVSNDATDKHDNISRGCSCRIRPRSCGFRICFPQPGVTILDL